jgi:hypothetical protein
MIITGLTGPEQTCRLLCVTSTDMYIFFEGIIPSDSLWFPLFEAFAPIYIL